MKSSTVSTALPGARRSPRPSCCRKIVIVAEKQRGVHLGDVQALVQHLRREQRVHLAGPQGGDCGATVRLRGSTGYRAGVDPGLADHPGHVFGVRHETQKPSARIRPTSVNLSRSSASTFTARASLPV
jgi:hypothetical protein